MASSTAANSALAAMSTNSARIASNQYNQARSSLQSAYNALESARAAYNQSVARERQLEYAARSYNMLAKSYGNILGGATKTFSGSTGTTGTTGTTSATGTTGTTTADANTENASALNALQKLYSTYAPSVDSSLLGGLMASDGTGAVYNMAALSAYDNQLSAYKTALDGAYQAQVAANQNQAKNLTSQYNASRNDVYTNARLNAIGNNERLAAKGLSGNLYDYARSGMSETSRIGQNVSMRKSLAAQTLAENQARDQLALELLKAQKESEVNYANKVAEVEAAKIPYNAALMEILAQAAELSAVSSGGGGGGGGYSYSGSSGGSSNSSGGSSNSSGGSSNSSGWDTYSIYKAAVDSNNGNYSAAYKALSDNKSAFTNAGASSKIVNAAQTVLHDQASGVNRTNQIKIGQALAAAKAATWKVTNNTKSSSGSGSKLNGK